MTAAGWWTCGAARAWSAPRSQRETSELSADSRAGPPIGAGVPIEFVYFMESGFDSVDAGSKVQIEIGLIGREGMSGLQHEVIAHLQLQGLPIEQAADILNTFQTLQKQHVADRDRLQKELATST